MDGKENVGEERIYFILYFSVTVHHRGKPGQELSQEPAGENRSRGHGERPLVATLSVFVQVAFFHHPGPPVKR